MRPARFARAIPLPWFLMLLLLSPLPALARSSAAARADTASVWTPVPGREHILRGTAEPIPRRYTTLRRAVRNLGYIPYAGLEILARPVVAIVRANEIYKITRRLTRVLVWDVDPMDSRLAARFGYETGFGLTIVGVNVKADDWFGSGLDYSLVAGYLNPRNNLVSLRFDRNAGGTRIGWMLRWEHKDDRPFYGLGHDSAPVRYDAHRVRLLSELSLRRPLSGGWTTGVTGYARTTDLDDPDDGPRVSSAFPDLFRRAESSRYRGLELALTHDTRDDGEFSTRGLLSHMLLGYNAATSGDDESYLHCSLELQIIRTLFHGNRSLVTRIFLEGLAVGDDARLPYTEMGRLGGRDCLRGFPRDRFTGTRSALLTLEYRYPVTSRIQGRIFSDWGLAANGWNEFRPNRMAWSGGMALAIRVHETPITAQVAGGRDGTQVFLGTTLMFSMKSRRLR